MRRLGRALRRLADRVDSDGAPQRLPWSFTRHEEWGTVFNQQGQGCPLYFYGNGDHQQAYGHLADAEPCEVEWVTIGSRTPDGVHVLGSAEVVRAVTTRRANGYDEVKVPGLPWTARIPRWRITLTCEVDSFVTLPGATYPEAVSAMFTRPGIRG